MHILRQLDNYVYLQNRLNKMLIHQIKRNFIKEIILWLISLIKFSNIVVFWAKSSLWSWCRTWNLYGNVSNLLDTTLRTVPRSNQLHYNNSKIRTWFLNLNSCDNGNIFLFKRMFTRFRCIAHKTIFLWTSWKYAAAIYLNKFVFIFASVNLS